MQNKPFKAMIISKSETGQYERSIAQNEIDRLPAGEVVIRVRYSSLNYKDALSASGNRGVTRHYPHTPGIDAAGIVEESKSHLFSDGDSVLVTGYDLGMNTAGGYGQYIRVPADWVVKLPTNLSLKESMVLGTAGFTAGLSVFVITQAVTPENGEILVTGASGGVGCIAVAILAQCGYDVVAVSGKTESKQFLSDIGAKSIIDREAASDTSGRVLLKNRWAGVVDTVGGDILSTAIRSTAPWGTVTCCGMVASPDLNLSVFPFILRGVRLIGIDSQECPKDHRRMIWEKLAGDWNLGFLDRIAREVALEDLNPEIDLILQGGQQGRIVVNLDR